MSSQGKKRGKMKCAANNAMLMSLFSFPPLRSLPPPSSPLHCDGGKEEKRDESGSKESWRGGGRRGRMRKRGETISVDGGGATVVATVAVTLRRRPLLQPRSHICFHCGGRETKVGRARKKREKTFLYLTSFLLNAFCSKRRNFFHPPFCYIPLFLLRLC